jgi:hypothetical protein
MSFIAMLAATLLLAPVDKAARWILAAISLSTVTIAVVCQGKYPYLWLLEVWLIVWCSHFLISYWRRTSRSLAAICLIFCGLGAGASTTLQQIGILLRLPTDQTLEYNAPIVASLVPAGSTVVTSEYWPVLGDKSHVLDGGFAHPRCAEIDYVVLTGNGSGEPGVVRPYWPECVNDRAFMVVLDRVNRQRASIMGVRISRSAYGFGPKILKRIANRSTAEAALR